MKKYITILILIFFMASCQSDDDSLDYALPCTCWEITDIGTFNDHGTMRSRVDFLQDCVRPRFSLFDINDPKVNEGVVGDCYNEIFM